MRLKSDFRRRLVHLRHQLNVVLSSDFNGNVHVGNLFPYLFSVYSFIWCHSKDKLFKK